MATNNFLPWGDNAGNIMDGADYEASTQRTDGVELGLADPALHNRLYRQVTLMAAALGQVIADSGLDATDSNMAGLVSAIKQVFAQWSGGTFGGSVTVSGSDPYIFWRNTQTNNLFGVHVYGTEDGKGVLAIYDSTRGEHACGAYSFSRKIIFEWPVELLSALGVASGGTGASDAAGARANLGITPGNIGAAPTSHTHSAGNITSGVISIERGGTGASDAAAARANLGALATSGGPITGYLQFGSVSNGLEWFTADGTQIHLRPYTPGNSFQITLKGPNTDDQETGAFNISTTGYVTLGRPLGLASGGLGRSFANEAALKTYLQGLLGLS